MPTSPRLRFACFELDSSTGQLRKNGTLLKLQPQPLRVLRLLAERSGTVVTREEIRNFLWSDSTFVDFEHGINFSINQIRAALADNPDKPRFVETLPRHGYRFLVAVEQVKLTDGGPQLLPAKDAPEVAPQSAHYGDASTTVKPLNWRIITLGITVGAICLLGAATLYLKSLPHAESVELKPIPFTSYEGTEIAPAFSPDGSRIAFAWDGNPRSGSKGFDLYVKGIGSENLLRLTNHPSESISPAWSPDGTQIAFHRIAGEDTGIYVVPALGGPERKLRSTHILYSPSESLSWSSDGKWIAFVELVSPANNDRIHLLSVDTLEVRDVSHAEKCFSEMQPAFSHSGDQLAYACYQNVLGRESLIYVQASLGGLPRQVSEISTGSFAPKGIAWTVDDKRLIVSLPDVEADFNLFEVSLRDGSRRKLFYAQTATWPAVSPRAEKLAYVASSTNVNIWRKDLLRPNAAVEKLLSSTREQSSPQYSPDGAHIAFESTRDGFREIWMSDADGTHLVQISHLKHQATGTPHWSPDSKKIVFDSWESGHAALYVVDISDLLPRKVVTNIYDICMPSWSRDGKWIYFQSGFSSRGIYRCPANGGSAVAILAGEGYTAAESFDRESIYFAGTRERSKLFLTPVNSLAPPSEIREMPEVSNDSLWTLVRGDIYFVPARAPRSLSIFDFKKNTIHQISNVDKDFDRGLSVSPDGRWILYSQRDEESVEIMVVDQFR